MKKIAIMISIIMLVMSVGIIDVSYGVEENQSTVVTPNTKIRIGDRVLSYKPDDNIQPHSYGPYLDDSGIIMAPIKSIINAIGGSVYDIANGGIQIVYYDKLINLSVNNSAVSFTRIVNGEVTQKFDLKADWFSEVNSENIDVRMTNSYINPYTHTMFVPLGVVCKALESNMSYTYDPNTDEIILTGYEYYGSEFGYKTISELYNSETNTTFKTFGTIGWDETNGLYLNDGTALIPFSNIPDLSSEGRDFWTEQIGVSDPAGAEVTITSTLVRNDGKLVIPLRRTITSLVSNYDINPIKIVIDGKEVETAENPFIYNDITLVPVRVVENENIGADVKWNEDTETATITKGATTIDAMIGKHTITINKTEEKEIDPNPYAAPVKLYDRATMLPVRAILEALKFNVEWNGNENKVIITKPDPVYKIVVNVDESIKNRIKVVNENGDEALSAKSGDKLTIEHDPETVINVLVSGPASYNKLNDTVNIGSWINVNKVDRKKRRIIHA